MAGVVWPTVPTNNERQRMERPDLSGWPEKARSYVEPYMEHLEGRAKDLEGRLAAAVGDPGAGAPRARATDPGTSRRAAFDAYPAAHTRRWTILHVVARAGERGMTQSEVANATGIAGVWKRLSELDQGGWAVPSGEERKGEAGSAQRVYVVTAKGREAVARDDASESRQASTKDRVPDTIPANLFASADEE